MAYFDNICQLSYIQMAYSGFLGLFYLFFPYATYRLCDKILALFTSKLDCTTSGAKVQLIIKQRQL